MSWLSVCMAGMEVLSLKSLICYLRDPNEKIASYLGTSSYCCRVSGRMGSVTNDKFTF